VEGPESNGEKATAAVNWTGRSTNAPASLDILGFPSVNERTERDSKAKVTLHSCCGGESSEG